MIVQLNTTDFQALPNKKDCSAIFGGTFDPIHEGHIQDIKFLASNMKQVFLAPTTQNPWKSANPTSLEHRIEMIKIALNYENIKFENFENHQNAPVKIITSPYTYSIDILDILKNSGEKNLLWAIGEDLKESAKKWKDWDTKGIPFLILPILNGYSATSVREKSIPPHPAIGEYIKNNILYCG